MSLSGISHSPAIANIAQSISLEGAKAWGADVIAKIAAVASEVFSTLSTWFAQGSAGAAAFYAANQAWLIPLGVAVGVVTVIGVGLAISKRYAAAKDPEASANNGEGSGVGSTETPANNGEGSGVGSTETTATNVEGAGVADPETPGATLPKEDEKEEEISVALNEMVTVTPKDFVELNRHVLTLSERVNSLAGDLQRSLTNVENSLDTILGYYQPNVSGIDSQDAEDSRGLNSQILNQLDVLQERTNRLTRAKSETAELNNTLSELQGEAGTSRRVSTDLPSPIKQNEPARPSIGEEETLNSEIAELIHTNGQQQAV